MVKTILEPSLFTSIVSFGVVALAVSLGIVVLLLGLAQRRLEPAETG